ncbi:MAG: prepilin-type N-terminal cleavage/methylation domain-containing protein [Planctomycetota bacterium JB042]
MTGAGHERGMTLVEVLAGVALLALLASALAAWTTTTARAARAVEGPLAWEAAARAALRQIEDDLLAGDEIGNPDAADRVSVDDGTLRVLTRERGPVVAVYAVEPETATLHRNDDRLLFPVAAWEVSIEGGRLRASVGHPDGRRVFRTWRAWRRP